MLQLFSPAKINLFLRIVNKRPDGYHNLSSLFQTVDLRDTLSFQIHHRDLLTCSDPSLPTDKSNLILQAIQLFRDKTAISIYLKVHLEKKIPIQAGLGGGSSNAATTLWALNQLSRLKIEESRLMEWGAEIGSDVAFFFSNGTAYCTGRGEKIRELDPLPEQLVWIIKPGYNQSTAAVYKRLNAPLEENHQKDLEDFLSSKISYFNDLEKPAFEIQPELGDLKKLLIENGFQNVLLSGSGSSFFCLSPGRAIPNLNLQVYPTKFINKNSNEWFLD